MGLLAPLAALLGLELSSLADRAKSTAISLGLIAVFGLVAAGFLLAAGYIALAEALTPIIAALIYAGVFTLLALAVYLGTLVGRSRRQRQIAEKRRSSETGAFLTTAALTALPMLTRSPLLLRLGIPAAIIAAFALMSNKDDGGRD
jgi:hypothetical protein